MNTSIGTGTPQDANENQPSPADPWPSRTLGADAPQARPQAPEASTFTAPAGLSGSQVQVSSDAAQPSPPQGPPMQGPGQPTPEMEAGTDGPLGEEGAHAPDAERISQAFPEGPNVAPSPWEDEAARGRS